MGYDMRWLRSPEGMDERVKAAHDVLQKAWDYRDEIRDQSGTLNWDRLTAARDAGKDASMDDHEFYDGRTEEWQKRQDAAHKLYEAYHDADESYFRLNIHGMGEYCRLMERFGMIFEAGRYPEWPKQEDYGVTDDQMDDYYEDNVTDESPEGLRKFAAAHTAVQEWHGNPDQPGIPYHKFGTNDGWIVTPEECRQAIAAWRESCKKVGDGDEMTGRAALLGVIDEMKLNSEYWLKWLLWIDRAQEYGGFAVR